MERKQSVERIDKNIEENRKFPFTPTFEFHQQIGIIVGRDNHFTKSSNPKVVPRLSIVPLRRWRELSLLLLLHLLIHRESPR